MFRQRLLYLALAVVLAIFSYGQSKRTTPVQPSSDASPCSNSTDSLPKYRLCDQDLTSENGIVKAFDNDDDGFFHGSTSIDQTFYYPDKDIADNDLAMHTQLFYNYVSALNYDMFIHPRLMEE